MKELNFVEVDQVNGGIWQFALGVAAGVVGNYVYESVGGAAGINRGFKAVADYMVDWDLAASIGG